MNKIYKMKKMMIQKKYIVTVLAVIIITVFFVAANKHKVLAKVHTYETVKTDHNIEAVAVNREEHLRNFFEKYNSELVNHVDTFIEVADIYGLDYRFLPAISCMESTCAKFYPEGSYNPFGWGIYGDQVIRFESFDEAIHTVGKGIHDGYVVKGADTPAKIAPIYTPPNHVHWLHGVNFFMYEIQSS